MRRNPAVIMLTILFLLAGIGFVRQVRAASGVMSVVPKEIYTRPKPRKPIKPTIPKENRYRTDRVFLEHADSLIRRSVFFDSIAPQIVVGNVKFRQGNMWMFCDSAYYFAGNNSMDAFGNVRMEEGDTLFVYADKMFYNGDFREAVLEHGPTRNKVMLKDPQGTLITDTLHYDVGQGAGRYYCGGELNDGVNTLTSVYGEYLTRSHDAFFCDGVELVNEKDGFRLLTDTLFYNTNTHIARIVSPTRIFGRNDTVYTSSGWYNTLNDSLELTSRSTIIHNDSTGRVTALVGDSIIYDHKSRTSRAYSFAAPDKISRPVVLTDTARKAVLYGGMCYYNDSTRTAYAADYPLLIEYSRPDSLFLRADTVWSFVRNDIKVPTDSTSGYNKEYHLARAEGKSRFFNVDVQGVADTIIFSELDSLLHLVRKPVVWSDNRQITGGRIIVHLNDSTADWADLPEEGLMVEHVEDDFYNQLTGKKIHAVFEDGSLSNLRVEGNVMTIFLPMEDDSTYNRLVYAEAPNLDVEMDKKEMKKLKMWEEVSGDVTPLFLVKNDKKFLRNFVWLEAIRPRREWYGDRFRWEDELGEVPDELINYFGQ